MPENETSVYQAKTIQDLVYLIKTINKLAVFGGCTTLSSSPAPIIKLPDSMLVTRGIEEMSRIEIHERYIDVGAAASLAQIEELAKKKLPPFLLQAIQSTATPFVRNIATLAGNIFSTGIKKTLYAPLLALDARLELHSPTEIKSIPMNKFTGIEDSWAAVKIRIPVEDWDIAYFCRVGPSQKITEDSASFVFLAKTQKDVLTDIRIAFCGSVCLRSTELENTIVGTRLPISQKTIQSMTEKAAQLYDEQIKILSVELKPLLRRQWLNLVTKSLEMLT